MALTEISVVFPESNTWDIFFLSSWICVVCYKSNLLFWAEMFHQSNASDHVTSYRSYTTFSIPEEGEKLVKICSLSIDR